MGRRRPGRLATDCCKVAVLALVTASWLAPAAQGAPPPSRWCGTEAAAVDRRPDAVSALQVHVVYAFPADGVDLVRRACSAARARPCRDRLLVAGAGFVARAAVRPLRPPRLRHRLRAARRLLGSLCRTAPPTTRTTRSATPAYATTLAGLGFADPDKKYLVYYEGPVGDRRLCGQSVSSVIDGGPRAPAAVYLGSFCGEGVGSASTTAAVAVHELLHSLGALPRPTGGAGPPTSAPTARAIRVTTARHPLPRGRERRAARHPPARRRARRLLADSGPWDIHGVRRAELGPGLSEAARDAALGPASLTAPNDSRAATSSWPVHIPPGRAFDLRGSTVSGTIGRTDARWRSSSPTTSRSSASRARARATSRRA